MATAPSRSLLFAHWHTLLETLDASPLEFYRAVEAALQRRNIPDATPSRVDWREAGLTSAKREYLRITRGRHACDICVAPFGSGFFVSWWLGEPSPSALVPTIAALLYTIVLWKILSSILGVIAGALFTMVGLFGTFWLLGALMSQSESAWEPYLLAIPVLGTVWGRFFRPATYYRTDTALMFQETIRRAVLEVIDGMTEAKGLRALSEAERKPILRDFWRR